MTSPRWVRQRHPTSLALLARTTERPKPMSLFGTLKTPPQHHPGTCCSVSGLTPLSTATASSSSSSSSDTGRDGDTDVLLGQLLFGAHPGQVADASSPCCSAPAAPSVQVDITTPMFSEAATVPPTAGGGDCAPPRLRRSHPPPRLAQTTLDFGQGGLSMATRCPHCDMLYTAEDDEDAALHRRFCRGERLRRRARTRCDLASSFAAIPGSRRLRTEASVSSPPSLTRTAVAAVHMLEELSGVQVGQSPVCERRYIAKNSSRGGKRGREIVPRAPGKTTHYKTGTLVDGDGICAPPLCSRVLHQLPPSSQYTTPLEVFHLVCDARRLMDSTEDCTTLRLLDALNLTPVILRAAVGVAVPPVDLSSARLQGASRETKTHEMPGSIIHVVCVVDTVLRQLLCAVAGESRTREQEPEVRVGQMADGGAVCTLIRHFTYGDVGGLWLCSPAVLSASQEAWTRTTAAPFVSTRHQIEKLFGLRTGHGAPPTTQSRAGHTTDNADEQCHRSMGIALHTLAQHLVYGKNLSPSLHLSYAQAALAAAAACVGADGFIEQSLEVVSPCYPADVVLTPREDEEGPLQLYTHDYEDAISDSDDSKEGWV